MPELEMRAKIDQILKAIEKVEHVLDKISSNQQVLQIWRATVEEQLRQGNRSFEDIRCELGEKIDKKVVLAYIAGAAVGAAGLVKLLGG